MAPPTAAPTSSTKRSYDDMSQPELIKELEAKDEMIQSLEKRLKASPAEAPLQLGVSPAKAQQKAEQLRSIAFRGIKSQMKWKPSCKHGTARWSFAGACDEATFRAFMGTEPGKKTKGGKIPVAEFEDMLGNGSLEASIRYGYLSLKGVSVNVMFKKDDGEIRISGAYGL